MKRMKKILSIVLAVALVVCCVDVQPAEAKTILSKKQVQSKISSIKKDIKKLDKKYKAALKKEKKEKKGTTAIMGEVVSRDPYIVHMTYFTNSYYWVLNPQNLDDLLISASGYVIPTGRYRQYNGVTCTECKAVKCSNKSSAIKKSIDKKREVLTKYRNVLKEKVCFEESSVKVTAGKTMKLPWYWCYGGAYNKITWKSSNTAVATVDSNGKVTGKKDGTATITATCSASGKTTKCTVKVITVVAGIKITQDTELYKSAQEIVGNTDYVTFQLQEISPDDITVESSNEDVAIPVRVEEDCFYYRGIGCGTTTFTVTDGTYSAQVTLTITSQEDNNNNKDDYDSYGYGDYDGNTDNMNYGDYYSYDEE